MQGMNSQAMNLLPDLPSTVRKTPLAYEETVFKALRRTAGRTSTLNNLCKCAQCCTRLAHWHANDTCALTEITQASDTVEAPGNTHNEEGLPQSPPQLWGVAARLRGRRAAVPSSSCSRIPLLRSKCLYRRRFGDDNDKSPTRNA